jgi:hypothetical protein
MPGPAATSTFPSPPFLGTAYCSHYTPGKYLSKKDSPCDAASPVLPHYPATPLPPSPTPLSSSLSSPGPSCHPHSLPVPNAFRTAPTSLVYLCTYIPHLPIIGEEFVPRKHNDIHIRGLFSTMSRDRRGNLGHRVITLE